MPHSSGGGSHSGGSHSSSSSSSSSYSGGGSIYRTENHYFSGAHQYVRYTSGKAEYVYSTDASLNKSSPLRFLLLLVYVPFFVVLLRFGAPSVLKIPTRLPLSYNTLIQIEDNLGVIEDENQLRNTLERFLDDTGISIAVLTDTNATWDQYYDTMENYAYDMYVTRFPDESHWLICYSTAMNGSFDNWHFEGMQGNDTDNVLTIRLTDVFNQSLTKYLMQSYPLDRALEKALADMRAAGLMKVHVDWAGLAIISVISVFLLVHLCLMLRDPNKKYRDFIPCPVNAKEEYCEYCGSAYWPGTILECPNCGAPLKKKERISI